MIKDIYKMIYMRDTFSYIGTLRNAKKFNINDNIFYAIGQRIIKGRIVGVELLPSENPEYRYKIDLPEDIVRESVSNAEQWYSKDYEVPKTTTLTCDSIFSNIEEAKQSAIKDLENKYELQKEEIEKYFNQFYKK